MVGFARVFRYWTIDVHGVLCIDMSVVLCIYMVVVPGKVEVEWTVYNTCDGSMIYAKYV